MQDVAVISMWNRVRKEAGVNLILNYSWPLNNAEVNLGITYSWPSVSTILQHPQIQPTTDHVFTGGNSCI